ncbi:MAG: hypothetical protein KC933_06295, partial [Myxococcales bacterium]|nr:hypothetical protein [Myxococcales bacterium]
MLAGAREALPENRTQLALQLRWSSYARTLSGAQVVNAAGDQRLTAAFASASVQHFLGHGWSVDLSVPVGVVQLESNTSPSASTLVGLADIEVGGRYDFAALWGAVGYRPSLTLRLGLGFPSGRRGTFDAPGLAPNLVATGSGTNSASGNLAFTQFVHKRVGLHAWLGVWAPMDRADDGLRPGPQLTFGLGGFWQVVRPLAVAARLDGRSIGRADERENGTVLASGGHTLA